MLYRKDDPFDRVLLFSAMRRMILRLRYYAVCRVARKIVSYCVHAGAVGNDERYIVRLGRYENKTRWRMALFMRHFECCGDKLRTVLF